MPQTACKFGFLVKACAVDMSKLQRNSYLFLAGILVLVGVFHLATPLLAVLFSFFALKKLRFIQNKVLSVVFFLVVLSGLSAIAYHFIVQAVIALPKIISTTLPAILNFATRHNIELPFEDVESLKTVLFSNAKNQAQTIGLLARTATKEIFFFVLGIAAAVSIFMNSKVDLGRDANPMKDNLYALFTDQVVARFRTFFQSFEIVMGAQLLISAINTVLTSFFIIWAGLPYTGFLIILTFLAGLLPIIGNLISNTLIVVLAFTLSPQHAIGALVFLVVLHKLEYFLNSKIVGDRIKNPMWLTLLGLIIAERLMGVAGMILAPIILNYIKVESSQIRSTEKEAPASAPVSMPPA